MGRGGQTGLVAAVVHAFEFRVYVLTLVGYDSGIEVYQLGSTGLREIMKKKRKKQNEQKKEGGGERQSPERLHQRTAPSRQNLRRDPNGNTKERDGRRGEGREGGKEGGPGRGLRRSFMVSTTIVEEECWGKEGGDRSTLETTQGQIDSFCSQLPCKCYLPEVAFVGD